MSLVLLVITGDICGFFFVQDQKMPTWQLPCMQSLDLCFYFEVRGCKFWIFCKFSDVLVFLGWAFPIVCTSLVYQPHPRHTMWLRHVFCAKMFSQICLFVFFLYFFGFPNIKRYQDEEVMVVTSVKHLGGILAPKMSIVAWNPTSRNGRKSDEITRAEDIIEEVCGNVIDIKQCVVKETYNLADLVEYAHIGFNKGTLQKNGKF